MSKFKVWIDSPTDNTQDSTTFASDSQRVNGFAIGGVASSIRVNSALRQANLVTTAIIDTLIPNTNLDLNSSVSDLVTELTTYFNSLADASDLTNLQTTLETEIQAVDTKVDNLRTILKGTLAANTTSVTITNAKIKSNSIVSVYTSVYPFNPISITIDTGTITLTFGETKSSATQVAVILEGEY